MYEHVAVLFKDHADLLKEFTHFLPDQSGQAQMPGLGGRGGKQPGGKQPGGKQPGGKQAGGPRDGGGAGAIGERRNDGRTRDRGDGAGAGATAAHGRRRPSAQLEADPSRGR